MDDTEADIPVLNAEFADAAYRKLPSVRGWNIDPELSGDDYTTYSKDGKSKIAYRGTDLKGKNKWRDLGADVLIGLGLQDTANRLKKAKAVAERAQTKYGVGNVSTTGHSLGGTQAQYVNRKLKLPGTAFNAGSTPIDALTNRKYTKNFINYTADGDLISRFSNSKNTRNVSLKPKPKSNAHALANFV